MTKNKINDVQLILTVTANLVFLAAFCTESGNDLPEKTNHNERRRQRRFVLVFDNELVAIVTPRRDALLFHSLVLFAAIKQQ